MRCLVKVLAVGLVLSLPLAASSLFAAKESKPLSLHPDNPHYFLFRGKPTLLIGSSERYGAVLNLDFDYSRYLDELQARKLNVTRIFSGTYVEPVGTFAITNNTLAPATNRLICPWARSASPGYSGGGNKFDLGKWDDAYFKRLKDFVGQAGKRGIVVELSLFSPLYDEAIWSFNPMNGRNNINGVGSVARTNVCTLDKHGGLLLVQESLVRKLVAELKDCDNLYYEVCNEPYFGGVTPAWQQRIADTIADAELEFPAKHLIAENLANGKALIQNPPADVSIFNFHFAVPEAAVTNYALNKVIGCSETGFKGIEDAPYRMEGWELVLSGGGLFINLDYSFTVANPNGTFVLPPKQAGGGSLSLRNQLRVMSEFVHGLDFLRMKPDNSIVKAGVPDRGRAQALVAPGKQYAVYLCGGTQANLVLELATGSYQVEWINTLTGKVAKPEKIKHPGGNVVLVSPPYAQDIALRVTSRK
jgi:hypothetical protein